MSRVDGPPSTGTPSRHGYRDRSERDGRRYRPRSRGKGVRPVTEGDDSPEKEGHKIVIDEGTFRRVCKLEPRDTRESRKGVRV